MNRRRFLLISGSTILGLSSEPLNKPTVGLEFSVSANTTTDPGLVKTMLVEFEKFKLRPKYINNTDEKAIVTTTLEVENEGKVEQSSEAKLTNSGLITKSDIESFKPLTIEGITADSRLKGRVSVQISHPDFSDTYNRRFVISGELVTSGLVGWWPLGDTDGSPTPDISGNNNDGSLNGGVTQGASGKGGLLGHRFDSNSYVSIPNGLMEDLPAITLTAWVKPRTTSFSNDKGIITEGYDGTIVPPELGVNTRGDGTSVYHIGYYNNTGDGWTEAKTSDELTADEWHFLAGSYDQDKLRLYVDGSLVDSTNLDIGRTPSVSTDARIGSRDQNGNDFGFLGTIVDARIYDRKLTPLEIQSIYDLGRNGDSLQQSIEEYKSNR